MWRGTGAPDVWTTLSPNLTPGHLLPLSSVILSVQWASRTAYLASLVIFLLCFLKVIAHSGRQIELGPGGLGIQCISVIHFSKGFFKLRDITFTKYWISLCAALSHKYHFDNVTLPFLWLIFPVSLCPSFHVTTVFLLTSYLFSLDSAY